MSGEQGNPGRQFAAAWQVAQAALGEWRQRVAVATTEALDKLDPAVRAAMQAGRSVFSGDWRDCRGEVEGSGRHDHGLAGPLTPLIP